MDAYVGEIRPFAFGYAPQGWLVCDGRQYPFQNYQALFAVIGNIYGGTPNVNFNVPDLRGQAAVGAGAAAPLDKVGNKGGEEGVALTTAQIPSHTHNVNAFGHTATQVNLLTNMPANNVFLSNAASTTGTTANIAVYANTNSKTALNANTIGPVSTAQVAHENRMPYLVMNYCICYQGIYPPKP